MGSKELFRKVDNENWIEGPRLKINLKQDSIGSVILKVYIYIDITVTGNFGEAQTRREEYFAYFNLPPRRF